MAYDLYVVTDEEISGLSHTRVTELALAGGADVIQLRDKKRSTRELVVIAKDIKRLTRLAGAICIINDRLDLALATEADGVHLGQDDLPVSIARKIAPEPFIIGVSVGTVSEALQAEKEGASYIAVSPVFATASKNDAGPGLGLKLLQEIHDTVSIPLVGIGGIGLHNVHDVIYAGADGVAVISAVIGRPDISRSARELKEQIMQAKRKRKNPGFVLP